MRPVPALGHARAFVELPPARAEPAGSAASYCVVSIMSVARLAEPGWGLEPKIGVEPTTYSLRMNCSTN